ncbi:ZIP family metal transporter [archaeon]|nr:ZIP family metal transporter [archaeon]
MSELLFALISVILVSLVSLIGIITFSINIKKLSKILIYLVSFSVGALFGGAFLHLLPEAVASIGLTVEVSMALLSGIIVFFVLEKFVHWHHCHDIDCVQEPRHIAYMNIAGEIIHNFIDGLVIGSAYIVNVSAGISVTLAVIFHEIPQEIGDFAVLIHSGFSRKKALISNFLVALTSIIGVIASFAMATYFQALLPLLLPFAAGGFIYIAGTDLIPELHKESGLKRSFGQLVMFVLGIAIMYALLLQ